MDVNPTSKFRQFIIDLKKFRILQTIKSGAFGSVSSVEDHETGKVYAAKVLITHENELQYKKMINREIGIMIRCQHPTIIKFYGYSIRDFHDDKNVTIIMELATKGSLYEFLEKIKKGLSDQLFDNTTRQNILVGIARGMMYLHQHQIIHRDLKPGNILLDDDLHPHITDFGLSKIFDNNKSNDQSNQYGTSMYMAPEVIEGTKYNRKADVYSFAILMYEVVTDLDPYPLLQNKKISPYKFNQMIVEQNYRPEFTVPVKKSIKQLIEKCWSKDPNERPTFEEIFKKLAYNVEDSVEDIYEDDEDDDYNKYYLEGVDADEVLFYAYDIDKTETNSSPLDKISKEVENLRKINKELKEENIELKKQIKNSFSLQNRMMTVSAFNLLPLCDQQFFVSQIISSFPEIKQASYFEELNKFLLFLSELDKTFQHQNLLQIKQSEDNQLFIDLSKDQQICILWKAAKILIKDSNDTATEFDDFINYNSNLLIEITYPMSFRNYYFNLMDIKDYQEDKEKIQAGLFITAEATENNYPEFSEYKYISSARIDTSVTKIFNRFFMGLEKLVHISIPSSVTEIGYSAFEDCSSLEQILIPSSVAKIGSCAFRGCTSLKQIAIPSSVNIIELSVFYECSSLTQIAIPSSVTKIEGFAFYGCSSLTQIKIPDNVTEIECYAFGLCKSLMQISIPSSVTKIGAYAFYECKSLTQVSNLSSVTEIGEYAFSRCSLLSQVSNLSSVTEIGECAFSVCTSLIKISKLSSVSKIGSYAFNLCSSLMQITIDSSSLKKIEDYLFIGCTSLIQASIPSSVEEIGEFAFFGCTSLMQITIPISVKRINRSAFDQCKSLKQIVIPINVTEMRGYVFNECSSLTQVSILSSLPKISSGTFNSCISLTELTIPSSVTKIEKSAFEDCSSLTQITIPSSVTEIEKNAFENCNSLTQITIPSSVTQIGDSAFRGCSSLAQVSISSSFQSSLSRICIPTDAKTTYI